MSKPTKTAAARAIAPAMSPFDVEMTSEAQRHLAATISQITLDFLAKGLRQVAVPLGQANAVKTAFESPPEVSDLAKAAGRSRWHVEIAKVNGLFAELHFSTEGDPVLTPREGETFADFCGRGDGHLVPCHVGIGISWIWMSGGWRVPFAAQDKVDG